MKLLIIEKARFSKESKNHVKITQWHKSVKIQDWSKCIGRCDRISIPKIYDGRNYYFNKTSIDANFSDLLEDIDLANYYTVEQIMENSIWAIIML